MSGAPIVVIGGGHAGIQVCAALVAARPGQPLHLVCEEALLPYQRPPLSKTFLKTPDAALQWHRTEVWLADNGIVVHRGDAAVAIDRERRVVHLRSGREVSYERLVLATGSRARQLPSLTPEPANVASLRSAADALRVREMVASCSKLTVVGGGFIGLEVAATARGLGKQVQVLESAPRLLTRSVSPEVADHVLNVHRENGIDIRLGVHVGDSTIEGERLTALEVDGTFEPVDTLLLGIGGTAEDALASSAGLNCDRGIVVDEHLRTSDPAILAIGDCASFPDPNGGRRLRLESVQNAADQARTAAATLVGALQPYRALPWFWSDQGSLRLQMAGLVPADGLRHVRRGANPGSFSVLHYVNEGLIAVESVNASGDHIAARKMLERKISPDPATACDPARTLASLLGS